MRLSGLVDQIVKMLVAGQFERCLTRTPTDMVALLQSAANGIRPFVERRKQVLIVQADPQLGSLSIEGDKIRDAVMHLLLNAVKFTPDGGRIELTGTRNEAAVEITVRDHGIGIEPKCLHHIFDPFFTDFDVSRHSSGVFEFQRRGLGLGLTLVKAFVEMHGGRIQAHSQLGEGSTFVITLPVDKNSSD
ncbi:MAG: hypothetical protein KatS3mg105_0713 [Gemmatales bacterium]|nr:MAG: hypothetical protein KatS3mg105_0713 [Gemmatales bacterium]